MTTGKTWRWACIAGSAVAAAGMTAAWLISQKHPEAWDAPLTGIWQTLLAGGWTGYVVAILLRQSPDLETAEPAES